MAWQVDFLVIFCRRSRNNSNGFDGGRGLAFVCIYGMVVVLLDQSMTCWACLFLFSGGYGEWSG